jgi:hypothetical protein
VTSGRDERAGVGGKRSDFSVASMYNNICGFKKSDAQPVWNKVWKLNVPERIRTFIWMVVHNRLLTNSLKSVMGLSHSMCMFCQRC